MGFFVVVVCFLRKVGQTALGSDENLMRYRWLILEQWQVGVEGRSRAELQARARGTHACCIQVRTEYQTQGQAGTQLPTFPDLQTSSKWVPGNIRPSKTLHGKTACGQTREGTLCWSLLLESASGLQGCAIERTPHLI